MIVRLGTTDVARLAALHDICFDDPWSSDFLASLLSSPGVHAWAMDDAAFVLLRVVADEAEILSIGTSPTARRAGHARALMECASHAARAAGAARLFLEVAADNAAALALYRSLGFAEVGRRPRYYPGGIDALNLARRL